MFQVTPPKKPRLDHKNYAEMERHNVGDNLGAVRGASAELALLADGHEGEALSRETQVWHAYHVSFGSGRLFKQYPVVYQIDLVCNLCYL